MDKGILSQKIKEEARKRGFDICGIIRTQKFSDYICLLDKRVKEYPNSLVLYENLYELAYPGKKMQNAKSIIVCARRYNKYIIPAEIDKYFGKAYVFDGRLPNTEEYKNKVLFEEFLTQHGLTYFQDSTPARWAAMLAGIGHFGKNNFLYTEYGSWVWINTWLVQKELLYDEPVAVKDLCPAYCTMCIDACPTKALSGPKKMDRGLCIAQLSFYSKTLPSSDIREKMGTLLYGCDICQDVCPLNKNKRSEEMEFPGLKELIPYLSLESILAMNEKTFLEILQPRFWYIEKDRFWLWKSNVLRAMANSFKLRYSDYIQAAGLDEDERVKEMAAWVVSHTKQVQIEGASNPVQ